MRRRLKQGRIAPLLAAMVLMFAAMSGCEKGKEQSGGSAATNAPAAFVPRGKDPAYMKALKDVQTKRRKIAAQRNEIVEQMEKLVARARAALPEGATDEQVRNELLNNPRKYPGWRELSRMLRERNALANKELDEARRLVAARIMKEQKDISKRGGAK